MELYDSGAFDYLSHLLTCSFLISLPNKEINGDCKASAGLISYATPSGSECLSFFSLSALTCCDNRPHSFGNKTSFPRNGLSFAPKANSPAISPTSRLSNHDEPSNPSPSPPINPMSFRRRTVSPQSAQSLLGQ